MATLPKGKNEQEEGKVPLLEKEADEKKNEMVERIEEEENEEE